MNKAVRYSWPLVVGLLAGCSWNPMTWWSSSASPPPAKAAPAPVAPAPAADCGATGLQDRVGALLIGSTASAPVGPTLRVSDLPLPHRIIPDGSILSDPRDPARLSVFLDARGRIARLECQ
ncbi:hypothetical protein [Pararhodospirillum photometricum]|uniref:hypothetical protein n=1 Tax=Pararhodospirillum photometricum TaxID=1084 RepID=UPI0002E9A2FC|nr:hypothetical protein [Pararhodospirillum photometricum]